MLSEEEKKLLKIFKAQVEKEETEYFSVNVYTQLLYDSHKTVLNIITKLQKENEHQTEKINNQKCELAVLNEKQKDMNKLINDVKSYKGQFKRQEKQIRELQKENEEKDKKIDNAINEVENIRQYFSEDLQPEFIRVLEILKY